MQETLSAPEIITVQPNPASTTAYLSFTANENHKYTIMIADMGGKVVLRKTGDAVKGKNMVNIDVRSYTNGIYIVSL
jgi:hypothetical protein